MQQIYKKPLLPSKQKKNSQNKKQLSGSKICSLIFCVSISKWLFFFFPQQISERFFVCIFEYFRLQDFKELLQKIIQWADTSISIFFPSYAFAQYHSIFPPPWATLNSFFLFLVFMSFRHLRMLIIDPSDTGREKIPSVVEEAGHTAVLTAVCILGNHITIYLQNIRGIKFAYVYLIFELKSIFFE